MGRHGFDSRGVVNWRLEVYLGITIRITCFGVLINLVAHGIPKWRPSHLQRWFGPVNEY